MKENKRKIKYSVQFKFVLAFTLLILMLLAFLNLYPINSMRDQILASKRNVMQDQASVIAASLAMTESVERENVHEMMELMDVGSYSRVLITDTGGKVLYDMLGFEADVPVPNENVSRALEGKIFYESYYEDEAFVSCIAVPIQRGEEILGAVYLRQYDSRQGDLLSQMQRTLLNISIVLGIVSIFILLLLTRMLTARLTELVKAIRIVGGGKYSHRVAVQGSDEVAELAEEFNNLTERLENTEELRRRFVSDASHELKTPLASIRLLSDSIIHSKNMSVETMREFITDIGAESERLRRITEKLLNLTRLDSRTHMLRVPVDMKATAENTLRMVEVLAEAKGVQLAYSLDDGCVVLANEDDIYQIIFNLVENAIKYNSAGGSVFLQLQRMDNTVSLTVEDTGIGIPEEDLPNIFTRFYRVDKARSREAGGSGLGLSIVHDTAMLHGGEISVSRREPKGTMFTVRFPLYSAEMLPEQQNESGES